MKTIKLGIGLFVIIAIAFACKNTTKQSSETPPPPPPKPEKVELFNGEDLTGLSVYIEDESYNKDSVFMVKNGMLYTTGVPKGYIQTDGEYENYKLNVEWRWVAEPANSGVLLHKIGKDKLWPTCIEAQLMSQNAGDFVAMGGRFKEWVDTTSLVVAKREESNEKPAGEWNRYEITCDGNSITLYVNGILQNEATETSLTKGKICLQSEGGPVEFRNLYLIPLD